MHKDFGEFEAFFFFHFFLPNGVSTVLLGKKLNEKYDESSCSLSLLTSSHRLIVPLYTSLFIRTSAAKPILVALFVMLRLFYFLQFL